MAAPQNYLHAIRSIQDIHPNIPAVLEDVDLNHRIEANTPINRAELVHAKHVARILREVKDMGNDPLITEAVVQTAELRANAVEAAHAIIEFAPLDLVQELRCLNNQLEDVDNRLSINNAISFNTRIIMRNAYGQMGLLPYNPLQKTTPGHGLALAQAAAHDVRTRNGLVAPPQIPAVGELPPNFNADLPAYNHLDILNLIIFYNDNFGIAQGDTLMQRIECFRRFLLGF